MWNKAGVILLLAGCLWTDIRWRSIPGYWLGLNGLLAAGLSLAGLIRWQALFLGMVPGAVLLAAAFATRGGIGGGDALMVLVIGMYLGPWDSFFILMVGLVLVAVYGIFWKICRHISLKRAVCFTPFLGIGFGVWWMLEWIGGGV